jgi:hypothetical protein
MTMAPPIVREFVPLIATPLLPVDVMALMVRLAQAAVASTVTVTPLFTMQVSDAVGTAAPPQVAELLQLPLTDAVLIAAKAFFAPAKNKIATKAKKTTLDIFFTKSLIFLFY